MGPTRSTTHKSHPDHAPSTTLPVKRKSPYFTTPSPTAYCRDIYTHLSGSPTPLTYQYPYTDAPRPTPDAPYPPLDSCPHYTVSPAGYSRSSAQSGTQPRSTAASGSRQEGGVDRPGNAADGIRKACTPARNTYTSALATASPHPPSPAATPEEATPQSPPPSQLRQKSSPTPSTFSSSAHPPLPSSSVTHHRLTPPPGTGAAPPHRARAYLP
ncbi:hypothetical protein V502_04844 [Pseudogymnoascus sp. VKM F-4520 (FW-2644)]|nr:hypothetical protein V502_04844 [Pseudogymnoascus sp. VKM F-4520 (FW-2644)]